MQAQRVTVLIGLTLWVAGVPAALRGEGEADRPPSLVIGDYVRSASGGDYLGYCNGATLYDKGLPVVSFGVNQRPKEKARYLYIILFKTAPAKAYSYEAGGKGGGDADEAESTVHMVLDGKRIEVAYQFKADRETHALRSESLKVGDIRVREGDPRVFVADLTGDKLSIRPVKVDLPEEVPDFKDKDRKDWAPKVLRVVEQLKKARAVRKALEGTPR
jgi:hypothetical protein